MTATAEITPAVERLAELNPTADTLAVTIRMALGQDYTLDDLDVAAELDLLTVEQYQALDRWRRRAQEQQQAVRGGRA